MELNEILQAVSTVGFPAVMCCALLWYTVKESDAHNVEIAKITEAVNDLKVAITQLTDKLS